MPVENRRNWVPDQRGCRVTSDAVVSDREGNPRAAESVPGFRRLPNVPLKRLREAGCGLNSRVSAAAGPRFERFRLEPTGAAVSWRTHWSASAAVIRNRDGSLPQPRPFVRQGSPHPCQCSSSPNRKRVSQSILFHPDVPAKVDTIRLLPRSGLPRRAKRRRGRRNLGS